MARAFAKSECPFQFRRQRLIRFCDRALHYQSSRRRGCAAEIKCADLELNVLISTEDVTARVNGGVKSGMDADQASAARGNAIAEIENESKKKTGLRSDVITLYQGGAYHLYRYKRYDDVRIVFAPEQQMAFYGGDPDNFEYQRLVTDICVFRVYE